MFRSLWTPGLTSRQSSSISCAFASARKARILGKHDLNCETRCGPIRVFLRCARQTRRSPDAEGEISRELCCDARAGRAPIHAKNRHLCEAKPVENALELIKTKAKPIKNEPKLAKTIIV